MAAPFIASKPFLPMKGKALISYPPSFLVTGILPAASTAATAKPPTFSTAAMATSFDHNYIHQLRPQPQPPTLPAAKIPNASPTIKPATTNATIARSLTIATAAATATAKIFGSIKILQDLFLLFVHLCEQGFPSIQQPSHQQLTPAKLPTG